MNLTLADHHHTGKNDAEKVLSKIASHTSENSAYTVMSSVQRIT